MTCILDKPLRQANGKVPQHTKELTDENRRSSNTLIALDGKRDVRLLANLLKKDTDVASWRHLLGTVGPNDLLILKNIA